jgi:hypothetical protein
MSDSRCVVTGPTSFVQISCRMERALSRGPDVLFTVSDKLTRFGISESRFRRRGLRSAEFIISISCCEL